MGKWIFLYLKIFQIDIFLLENNQENDIVESL